MSLTSLCLSEVNGKVAVKGEIKFESEPATLPKNSWLLVKVQDTSLMDAPSKTLGEYKKEIEGFGNGAPLKYEVRDVDLSNAFEVSVSSARFVKDSSVFYKTK